MLIYAVSKSGVDSHPQQASGPLIWKKATKPREATAHALNFTFYSLIINELLNKLKTVKLKHYKME